MPARPPPIPPPPGQGGLQGVTRRVTFNCHKTRHTAALLELAPHQMPRTLRRDHDNVHAFGRIDLAEVDIETVRETDRLARLQVLVDPLVIHRRLDFVRQGHNDQVTRLRRFRNAYGRELVIAGQLVVCGPGQLSHHHLDAGIPQILSVSMALAPVAEYSHLLALQRAQVGIFLVEDLHRHCA